MRLSKTQAELVAKAEQNGGRWSAEWFSGHGGDGGKVSGGQRKRQALQKLVEAGKVQIVRQGNHPIYKNGYCVWVSSAAYRLKEG